MTAQIKIIEKKNKNNYINNGLQKVKSTYKHSNKKYYGSV